MMNMMAVDNSGDCDGAVAKLIVALRSICSELEQHGVDTLMMCSASETVITSYYGAKFIPNTDQLLAMFNEFCTAQRNDAQNLQYEPGTILIESNEQSVPVDQLDVSTTQKEAEHQTSVATSTDNDKRHEEEDLVEKGLVIDEQENVENPIIETVSPKTTQQDTGSSHYETGDSSGPKEALKPVLSGSSSGTDYKDKEPEGSMTLKVVKIDNGKHSNLTLQSAESGQTTVSILNEKWNFIHIDKVKKDTKSNSYQCKMCKKSIANLARYREHFTKVHHTKIGYTCICKMFFSDEASYNKHVTKYKSSHVQCVQCEQVFTSIRALDEHVQGEHREDLQLRMEEETSDGYFECYKCETVFAHERLLKQHHKNIPNCDTEMRDEEEMDKELLTQEITYTDHKGKQIVVTYGQMLDKQSKPPYTCEICNSEHKRKSAFSRHLVSHLAKGTHTCNVCGAVMKGKEGLLRHLKKHRARPYKCDQCGTAVASLGELHVHCTKVCKPDLKCSLCDYVAKSKSALETHTNRHSGYKPLECSHCQKAFVSKAGLERHVAALHSEETPWKCTECDKAFKVKDNLKKHMKIHEEPKCKCPICGKTCTEQGNMNKHMLTHTKEKPFVCEVCGKKYGRKALLDNHYRIHTGEKPYPCKVKGCEKSFRSYCNLKQHERNHSKEKPFVCDVCGKAFKQPGRLSHHRKGHTNKYRWSCPYCEEKFKSIATYKNHLARQHPDKRGDIEDKSTIKLYECELCHRMFGDKEDLNRHIYIHNNERPFKCSHCDKAFNDKSNLRHHEKLHTGERKYKCGHCKKAFIIKRDLRNHHYKYHTEKGVVQVFNATEPGSGDDEFTIALEVPDTLADGIIKEILPRNRPLLVKQLQEETMVVQMEEMNSQPQAMEQGSSELKGQQAISEYVSSIHARSVQEAAQEAVQGAVQQGQPYIVIGNLQMCEKNENQQHLT